MTDIELFDKLYPKPDNEAHVVARALAEEGVSPSASLGFAYYLARYCREHPDHPNVSTKARDALSMDTMAVLCATIVSREFSNSADLVRAVRRAESRVKITEPSFPFSDQLDKFSTAFEKALIPAMSLVESSRQQQNDYFNKGFRERIGGMIAEAFVKAICAGIVFLIVGTLLFFILQRLGLLN